MRPIERGSTPVDANGNTIKFKEYGDAKNDLIKRLGDYCSYCEMKIEPVHVEHILPKKYFPSAKNCWGNFLLACNSCNSIKGDKQICFKTYLNYFWVCSDNTFRAFRYEKDRALQIALSLNPAQQKIAQNTLELTGLDRERGHPQFSKKDRRCDKRNEAWGKAERAKSNLQTTPTDSMREQIIDTATSTGFWSVWMTVFQDDIGMRQHLINAFTGTSRVCFDANTQPIPRAGGQL